MTSGALPELLSPAGNAECLRFALRYGADAVYLGAKEFGMRSSCDNFSHEELAAAAAETHRQGKKLYLTLNTLPTNDEVARMPAFLRRVRALGVDALIVADLGVLHMAKEHLPEAEIHLSTQAGITNYAAACAAFELGAARVILARELTLADIAAIRRNTPAELTLEVFVHGAMCVSVSGRCLLSQHLAGRDANRGQCAQSCRWRYSLVEERRPGETLPIGEGEGGSYILSADDLCTVELLQQIVAAGAGSLKIEGRGKSFYYVASATAAYRGALDAAIKGEPCPPFARSEVEKTSHRPYSTGFYLGREKATTSPRQEGYLRSWQVVGVVERVRDGWLYCKQRGKFTLGQDVELLLPEGKTVLYTPAALQDGAGNPIAATPHVGMAFAIPAPEGKKITADAILRVAVG